MSGRRRIGVSHGRACPDKDAPAAQLCNRFICTTYDDIEGLRALEAATDVITYEFENIPADALDTIAARVLPPVNALRISVTALQKKPSSANKACRLPILLILMAQTRWSAVLMCLAVRAF